jgi:hypothetical protein
MTNSPAEAELRRRFAALRDHDLALVPAFGVTLARAAARTAPARPALVWRLAWVGSGLAAVLLGLGLLRSAQWQGEFGAALQLAWRVPTDALLTPAYDPARGPSWDSLPTTALGRPSFSRYQENP